MGIRLIKTKMYKTIVILAIIAFANSRFILRDSPADISDCTDAPRQSMVGFQATWQETWAPGKTLSVTISATATEDVDIASGLVDTVSKGAHLDTRTLDLTQHVDAGAQFEFKYSYYLPGFTPKGDYTLTFNMLDSAGATYGCANINITF